MSHKTALLAVLALGTAFLSVPALAQQQAPAGPQIYQDPMSGPPIDPNIARTLATPRVGFDFMPGRYYDYSPGAVGWCQTHFRSYNPATGQFRGYDGNLHRCP